MKVEGKEIKEHFEPPMTPMQYRIVGGLVFAIILIILTVLEKFF